MWSYQNGQKNNFSENIFINFDQPELKPSQILNSKNDKTRLKTAPVGSKTLKLDRFSLSSGFFSSFSVLSTWATSKVIRASNDA